MRTGDFPELLTSSNSGGAGYRTVYPRCYPGLIPGAGNPLAGSTSPGLIFDPATCQSFGGNILRRAFNPHPIRVSQVPILESGRPSSLLRRRICYLRLIGRHRF